MNPIKVRIYYVGERGCAILWADKMGFGFGHRKINGKLVVYVASENNWMGLPRQFTYYFMGYGCGKYEESVIERLRVRFKHWNPECDTLPHSLGT